MAVRHNIQFTSRAREVKDRVQRGAKRGLFLASNDLKNEAQRLAPVDTGFLMNTITAIVGPDSGTVTGGTRDQQEQKTTRIPEGSAVVGAGARYARSVHELHATGRKFLETPARQNASAYQNLIADELRHALGSE